MQAHNSLTDKGQEGFIFQNVSMQAALEARLDTENLGAVLIIVAKHKLVAPDFINLRVTFKGI